MHTVVLARYQEDLDWIVQIPSQFEIFVYNKGDEITSPAVLERANHIIARPNVGQESETYAHHMMDHRKRDHNFTVFSPGDPFSHSPDFLRMLHNWTDWEKIQPMSWQWLAERNVPPQPLLDAFKPCLKGGPRVRPEYFSLYTWGPVDFLDQGPVQISTIYRMILGDEETPLNIASHVLRRCLLNDLADEADKHLVGTFSYGAIFAVRNDLISAISEESYQQLYEFANSTVPTYPYILERLWLHFFGYPFSLRRL